MYSAVKNSGRDMSVSVSMSVSISMSVSGLTIVFSIPKTLTRWRGNLKVLSHERGWVK